MRIGVRADQAGNGNLAVADPAHDVLEDAEGNDDAYRRSGCRGRLAALGRTLPTFFIKPLKGPDID
jgi:hypothetical protein